MEPAHVESLQVLVWHSMRPQTTPCGISKLTRLHNLALSLAPRVCPSKHALEALARDLCALPQLQRLALPAPLLRGTCFQHATAILPELLLQPTHDPSSSTTTSPRQQLTQLLFVSHGKGGTADHWRGESVCNQVLFQHTVHTNPASAVAGSRQPRWRLSPNLHTVYRANKPQRQIHDGNGSTCSQSQLLLLPHKQWHPLLVCACLSTTDATGRRVPITHHMSA